MAAVAQPRAALPPLPAEMIGDLWYRISEDAPFAVAENEVHYLSAVALGLDDDLASVLLLKKLKLAKKLAPGSVPDDLAVMNSFVEFRAGEGKRRLGQLLHPSVAREPFGLSVASRLGAGLVGLRAGQSILWPDDIGELQPLQVFSVRPAHWRMRRPRLKRAGPPADSRNSQQERMK